MKRRSLLLGILLLFAALIPLRVSAEGEDYLNYKFKSPLNDDKSVYFYVDDEFNHFVVAGKGKMNQNPYFGQKIDEFYQEKCKEIIATPGLSESEIEVIINELTMRVNNIVYGEGILLEIKSGVKLPDDSSGLFGTTSDLQFKNIIFPKDFDTSNVTNMQGMFATQKSLNPDLSNWDTSNVTDMSNMFYATKNANPDVSKWDTSKVENMLYMFAYAENANPDVSNWDTSSIKNEAIGFMFCGAEKADPDTRKWKIKDIDLVQNLFWGTRVSEVDMRSWIFKENTDSYDVTWTFQNTNNLQYIYLNADNPFSGIKYEQILAGDFKMQKDNEPASSVINGSHDKYIFTDTGVNTLYFVPQRTGINVVWRDNDNENGFRPEKQNIELLANGKKIETPMTIPPEENPVKLNKDNNWSHLYTDLDIFSNGSKIDYTVKSEDIDDYITDYVFKKEGTVLNSSQSGTFENQKDGFTVINTYMTIAEEKPLGVKPRVPKNFVKVTVNTTDTATFETKFERAFWVTPNIEIELPVSEPTGKENYEFDHWKAVDSSGQVWKKGKKIKAKFKEETKIEAQYGAQNKIIFFNTPVEVKKETHIAYIKGYPNDTVRPEGKITRAEAVTMVVRLKAYPMIEGKGIYKDVAKDEWYAPYVEAAFRQGILEEKEGEAFRPDENITRGELAQLISHIDKKNDAKAPFKDIESYKYKAAIDQSYGNERILGYPDNTFRPDAEITRAETVAMLNRLFERKVKEEGLKEVTINTFKDLKDKTHWAYYEIVEAAHTHEFVRIRPNAIEELWKTIVR